MQTLTMPYKRCTSYQGGVLFCNVVCVTECYSCGPAFLNPFIFKKQMGHARLEINGQWPNIRFKNNRSKIRQSLQWLPAGCGVYLVLLFFSLTRSYPWSILGSFDIFGMSLTSRKSSYWWSVGGSRRAKKEVGTKCDIRKTVDWESETKVRIERAGKGA